MIKEQKGKAKLKHCPRCPRCPRCPSMADNDDSSAQFTIYFFGVQATKTKK